MCVFFFSGADTAVGVVATLLELGADVNQDDGDPEVCYTPLHSAVANEVNQRRHYLTVLTIAMISI